MKDTHRRSLTKGITWRITASLTTMGLVYAFTGSWILMAEIGALEILAKLTLYYLHERAWGRVAWGRVRAAATLKR